MDKRTFEDLPSTNTPVNASNLNGMQSDIEKSVAYIGTTSPNTSENLWLKVGQTSNENAVMRKSGNNWFEFLGKNIIADMIYPVGSIYMSVNSTSPAILFGGYWEQIQDRFLLSAGSTYIAGSTGGEATHTLTINEIPSHTHSHKDNDGKLVSWIGGHSGGIAYARSDNEYCLNAWADNNGNADNTGGGQAHNNMPPYLAVYVWKRTV
jgi:hypothetical protein